MMIPIRSLCGVVLGISASDIISAVHSASYGGAHRLSPYCPAISKLELGYLHDCVSAQCKETLLVGNSHSGTGTVITFGQIIIDLPFMNITLPQLDLD